MKQTFGFDPQFLICLVIAAHIVNFFFKCFWDGEVWLDMLWFQGSMAEAVCPWVLEMKTSRDMELMRCLGVAGLALKSVLLFSASSSAQDRQSPRGTSEAWEPGGVQFLQLQHVAASRPVPPAHAQQADCRVGQQQQPAELRGQQACHVLRQRTAGPSQAQAPTWAGQEEQRPSVSVSRTQPGELSWQQWLLLLF